MAGRIGSAGCRTGSCMGRDKGDVAQRVAVHRCIQSQLHSLAVGPCMKMDSRLKGVLRWRASLASQCACVVRISVS